MFNIKTIAVSDEEMAYVENIFGFPFTDEQKKIIRFWDTIDIQACPGGGKTTTLAAKLIILANKLPINFESGICIITHTNVAVEEIKSKLGPHANFYFRYPNHFGTIQSFVDKFLAIPCYKNKYKSSPRFVDEVVYEREILKQPSLKYSLNLLERKKVNLGKLTFNRHNFNVSTSIDDTEKFVISGIDAAKSEKHYQNVLAAKKQMLKDGYIKYDEAYSLGLGYLRANNLQNFIVQRFPIVFIDEMQDMEPHQIDILTECFPQDKAIVQKIGDVNQAIYSSPSSKGGDEWQPNVKKELQITSSTRVADNILKEIRDVCVYPQDVFGWKNSEPIKPAIIVFDDTSIRQVKEKFGELVIKYKLVDKGAIKAIGARTAAQELCIQAYWNEFNKRRIKAEPKNLVSFLGAVSALSNDQLNTKEIQRAYYNAICRVLKLANVKNNETGLYFTPYTLSSHFNTINESVAVPAVNNVISKCIILSSKGEDIKQHVIDLINTVLSFFQGTHNEFSQSFIDETEIEISENVNENRIYRCEQEYGSVDIHFDTIHGVKGETHAATLYLETYTRIYDVGGKILDFIVSSEKQKAKYRKDAAYKRRLPLAYVAMTRPTHFLAIAVHKDRFSESYREHFLNAEDRWDVFDI